jgi:hypothetical protein
LALRSHSQVIEQFCQDVAKWLDLKPTEAKDSKDSKEAQ